MERAWAEMKRNISLANRINKTEQEITAFQTELSEALHSAVTHCRTERKRKHNDASVFDLSDDAICRAARFTDDLPLANYGLGILHLVPRLVNIVSVSHTRSNLKRSLF